MLLSLSAHSFGQTYFYARAIVVNPAAPNTSDNITLDIYGDYSASNSVITSTAFSVNGFEIDLTLNCASPGIGSTVLVPHTESVTIGSLPAGNYHINLIGTALGDFVIDTLDYYFTVSGPTTIAELVPEQSSEYEVLINQDSGLVEINQVVGAGMDIVQIIDMKGNVIKEIKPGNVKSTQVQLDGNASGIFLISIKSGDKIWSDLFSWTQ